MNTSSWRRLILRTCAVAAALTIALAALGAPTRSSAANEATVYLVQGLPGRSLDVKLGGKEVASGVDGATVVGPFTVAAGRTKIELVDDDKAVATATVDLEAGSSSDAVVHLPAAPDGDPVVTLYRNNLTPVQGGKAAHAVAHVAAVGPADIRVSGKVLFANVANGEFLYKVVPADTYSVDIVPAGTDGPAVIGPIDLTVKPGRLTWAFAIGDPGRDEMTVVTHEIDLGSGGGSDRPDDVDTGAGGRPAWDRF